MAIVDAADAAPVDGKDTPVPVPAFRPRPSASAALAVALDDFRLDVITPRGDVVSGGVADPATVASALQARLAESGHQDRAA